MSSSESEDIPATPPHHARTGSSATPTSSLVSETSRNFGAPFSNSNTALEHVHRQRSASQPTFRCAVSKLSEPNLFETARHEHSLSQRPIGSGVAGRSASVGASHPATPTRTSSKRYKPWDVGTQSHHLTRLVSLHQPRIDHPVASTSRSAMSEEGLTSTPSQVALLDSVANTQTPVSQEISGSHSNVVDDRLLQQTSSGETNSHGPLGKGSKYDSLALAARSDHTLSSSGSLAPSMSAPTAEQSDHLQASQTDQDHRSTASGSVATSSASPTPPLASATRQHTIIASPVDQDDIAQAARALDKQAAFPQRALRARKPGQINPYTLEMAMYKRRLERNDWEDAVVLDRQLRKQMREEKQRQEQDAGWRQPESSPSPSPSPSGRIEPHQRQLSERARSKQRYLDDVDNTARLEQSVVMPEYSSSASRGRIFDRYGGILTDSGDESAHASQSSSGRNRRHGHVQKRRKSDKNTSEHPPASPESDASSDGPLRRSVKRPARRPPLSADLESTSDDDNDRRAGSHLVQTSSESEQDATQSDASNKSTDYDALFKQLRRMMPFHMARKHIADLKNMKRGKAYHSDGHVSATPDASSNSSDSDNGSRTRRGSRHRAHSSTPATSPFEAELVPGEARRRKGFRNQENTREGRFELVGDSESDSDVGSVQSISSADTSFPSDNQSEGFGDTEGGYPADADLRWWTEPTSHQNSMVTGRRKDDIDRVLSRSAGAASTRRSSHSRHKPSRSKRAPSRRVGGGSNPTKDSRHLQIKAGPLSRKRKRRAKAAPREHRQSAPRRQTLGANPPIAEPRQRRRLDLNDEDVIFACQGSADVIEMTSMQSDSVNHSRDVDETQRHGEHRRREAFGPATPQTRGSEVTLRTQQRPQTGSPTPRLGPHIDSHTLQNTATTSGTESPGTISILPHLSHGKGMMQHSGILQGADASLASLQAEADAWSDLRNLRLDFGIEPITPGLSFAPETYIGRGRLHELLSIGHEHQRQLGHHLHVPKGFGLSSDMAFEDADAKMPSIFDAIFDVVSVANREVEGPVLGPLPALDDLLRCIALTATQRVDTTGHEAGRHLIVYILHHLHRLFERFQAVGIGKRSTLNSQGDAVAQALLQLRWLKVELWWRLIASADPSGGTTCFAEPSEDEEGFADSCRELVFILLSAGIHRSIQAIKKSQDDYKMQPGPLITTRLDDLPAEIWIRLIHLLQVASRKIGSGYSFGHITTSALERWAASMPSRRPVLSAEALWYIMFALCALSQFSAANGSAGSSASLAPCWSIALKAIDTVPLRYPEAIEMTMSNSALFRRDRYVHALVGRCYRLHSTWGWTFEGSDAVLAKLFGIFNIQRLTNLPTDEDHDFPPFLRHCDVRLLYQDPQKDPGAFSAFISLLAIAAKSMESQTSDTAQAEKKVSRLCSRLSPVRIMPFSKTQQPTSHERSSLFNHYTFAILHLYLVPSSAAQRLRQIKSFLRFSEADAKSQITCIRAMVYAAAVLNHHELDVSLVTSWMSSIINSLLESAEGATQQLSANITGKHFESVRKLKGNVDLLLHSLRSIQHMIQHSSMEPGAPVSSFPYPDPRFIDCIWTSGLLDSQVALDNPAIAMEALQCIQAFLLRRNVVMRSADKDTEGSEHSRVIDARPTSTSHESQDSFSDLFDDGDFDFADPSLDRLLANAASSADVNNPRATRKDALRSKDAAFAEIVQHHLSPSLFRLLSNNMHPDRRDQTERISLTNPQEPTVGSGMEGSNRWLRQVTKCRVAELLVDCWAGCASLLVQNGLRDWHGYLNYGNESWKRLSDVVGRRDIGLRFLQNVAMLDPTAYLKHQSEFLQVWFQAAGALSLTVQAAYTHALTQVVDPSLPWFKAISAALQGISLTTEIFSHKRTQFIVAAAMQMDHDFDDTTQDGQRRRSMAFSCLSAFLSSIRAQLDDCAQRPRCYRGSEIEEYFTFCEHVLAELQMKTGDRLMRGLRAEIERTKASVAKASARCLPPNRI
ncbi:unnamed protein product [Sympodiomycopsis kandeliae]